MMAMLTVHRAVVKAQKHLHSKLEEKNLTQIETTHPGGVENESKTSTCDSHVVRLLTLGKHAQEGYCSCLCLSVCLSVCLLSHISSLERLFILKILWMMACDHNNMCNTSFSVCPYYGTLASSLHRESTDSDIDPESFSLLPSMQLLRTGLEAQCSQLRFMVNVEKERVSFKTWYHDAALN